MLSKLPDALTFDLVPVASHCFIFVKFYAFSLCFSKILHSLQMAHQAGSTDSAPYAQTRRLAMASNDLKSFR